jgi:hypothetical protein
VSDTRLAVKERESSVQQQRDGSFIVDKVARGAVSDQSEPLAVGQWQESSLYGNHSVPCGLISNVAALITTWMLTVRSAFDVDQ